MSTCYVSEILDFASSVRDQTGKSHWSLLDFEQKLIRGDGETLEELLDGLGPEYSELTEQLESHPSFHEWNLQTSDPSEQELQEQFFGLVTEEDYRDDQIMLNEDFNNWVDSLHADGLISSYAARTYESPEL